MKEKCQNGACKICYNGKGDCYLFQKQSMKTWQKKFLEAGTYETGTDLSCMISTVSEILAEQKHDYEILVSTILEEQKKELMETLGKYQIMVGNLVYNNENEAMDVGIKQILKELINDKESLKHHD